MRSMSIVCWNPPPCRGDRDLDEFTLVWQEPLEPTLFFLEVDRVLFTPKMRFPLQCSRPASSLQAARQFHCTPRVLARRDVAKRMPLPRDLVEFDIEQDFPEFSGNDIPSGAHIALHQQRQLAYYMRLIENEMPKFVGE